MQVVTQGIPASAIHISTEAASNSAVLLLFRTSTTAKNKQFRWRQGSLAQDGNPRIYNPYILSWRELYASLMHIIKYGYSWCAFKPFVFLF